MRKKRVFVTGRMWGLVWAIGLAVVALAGCRWSSHREGTAGKPLITVSIEPLRFVVGQIAGPDYEVESLVPAGSSPETYEPTPAKMVGLNESLAYFSIGTLPFEQTLLQRLSDNVPGLTCVRLSDVVAPLPALRTPGGAHGDPHVWTSPRNVRLMARQVCHMLTQIDTARAALFSRRLERFERRLDSLDGALHRRLSHATARTFMIYHPALAYFARDYGFRQVPIEADGKEPSPMQLAALIRQARRQRASGEMKLIFVQRELSDRAARQIARQTGLQLVVIDPLSADWLHQMDVISKALAR